MTTYLNENNREGSHIVNTKLTFYVADIPKHTSYLEIHDLFTKIGPC